MQVMKRVVILFLTGFMPAMMYAQQKEVTGQVTDTAGAPLPGVAVTVQGTQQGITTDLEGNYTIQVPGADAVLVFSFLGMQTVQETVGDRKKIDVMMQPETEQLEELVVVGYGVQRKSDVTGSISTVEGEELAKQPVQTPSQAMQGKMSGVQVIGSGRPNSQPQVRIRGTGSVLAGAEPLYVVDGVLTDDIRNINNADIVSMEVLKDASAAIYGVRAANGVVIITTRQGEQGPPKVSYQGNAGFRQAANLVDMAGRDQYMSYLGDVMDEAAWQSKLEEDQEPLTIPGTTDWYDGVMRNALQMNHNLSVSGGSEHHRYYFSAGYFKEDGIIQTNNFDRFTLRANNDVQISEKLKLISQLSFARNDGRDVNMNSVFNNAYRAAPIIPVKVGDKYGNPNAWGNVGNPLLSLEKRNDGLLENRLQGNLAVEYKPVSSLTFRSAFNTDLRFGDQRTYTYQFLPDEETFVVAGGNQREENSRLNVIENRSTNWVWDNTLTFNKDFDDHALTVMVGSVTERFDSRRLRGERINVPEDEDLWYLDLGNPETQSINEGAGDRYARQSFLGRVNYAYAGKYLVSTSLRADGSSRFSERWGYFPTVGLGWVISEEGFMQDQGFFDRLKIRGSWGILGNDNIPTNEYITFADVNIPYFFNNGLELGSTIQEIKDEDLKWETTHQYDIGIEFELFDNRLSGEIDYYNKRTEDALTIVAIPATLGDPDNAYITNASSFRNSGVEFALSWNDEINEDISYRVGGNMTFNKNEVIGLAGGQALLSGSVGQQSFVTRTDNGVEVGSFYVRDAMGVFPDQAAIDAYVNAEGNPIQPDAQPGDLQYRDVNGDGIITDDDKIYAGSYQPKFYYGFNLGLNYRNFDLSADFTGNAGNHIYNGKKAFRYEITDNIEADYANNRWTAGNPSGSDPRVIEANIPASTYFVESGSFLRLNNLTLGYTIPTENLGPVSSLRVFLTSQNLFTIQRFSGFTPELPGGQVNPDEEQSGALDAGIELNAYPTTRTFAAGLNVTF